MKKTVAFVMMIAIVFFSCSAYAQTNIENYATMLTGEWEQFATYKTENQDLTQSFVLFSNLTYPAEQKDITIEGFKAKYTIYLAGDETGEVDMALLCEGDYYYSAYGRLMFSQDGKVLMIKENSGGIYLYRKVQ